MKPATLTDLMAALRGHLGGAPVAEPHPALPALGPRQRVLLLVIDGLGAAQLAHYPRSFLARHRRATLETVFPSTTATAMTTYLTGAPPTQHAIPGWFTWFRELGCVTTVLPFTPRYKGPPLSNSGITPAHLIGAPPLFDAIATPSRIIYPSYIVDSDFTRATSGRAERLGYETLDEFTAHLERAIEHDGPLYLFAYWPFLDSTAHSHGAHSPEADAHFAELDAALARVLPRLAAAGFDVLVSADHGFIDSSPRRIVNLADHPELEAMLTLPLCGEPRTAYCYVRAGSREQFEAYVRANLADACTLHRSEALLDDGWFGPPPIDPHLRSRIGDYTLLMKENWVIKDYIVNERPFSLVGVHGGASREEMEIPLIVLPAEG